MPKLITCPSGLKGEIRGLKGKSFELLGDKRLQREGLLGDKLLRECWVETVDPGPYELEDGQLDWQKVLVGDRTYALIQIRACMYGPQYVFNVPCQECRERIEWPIDLLKDLPVKTLAKEDLEAFKNGNRLRGELADGRVFWFRLPTGEDEKKAAKFGSMAKAFIPSLVSRLHEIEGLPEMQTMRKFFEEEEAPIMFEFLQVMDDHDCGVDTAVEIACSRANCGAVQTVNIPFARGFLLPDTTKKRTTAE